MFRKQWSTFSRNCGGTSVDIKEGHLSHPEPDSTTSSLEIPRRCGAPLTPPNIGLAVDRTIPNYCAVCMGMSCGVSPNAISAGSPCQVHFEAFAQGVPGSGQTEDASGGPTKINHTEIYGGFS